MNKISKKEELKNKLKELFDFVIQKDEKLMMLFINQNLNLYYENQTDFIEVLILSNNINIVRYLFSLKLDQELINKTFVMCAEKRCSKNIIEFIISYNPDVNFYYEKIEDANKNNKHYSIHHAISYFAFNRNIEMIKFLIEKEVTIENKEIAFRWAVYSGSKEIIDMFLNDKINIDCVDKNDPSYGAINIAIRHSDIETIEHLINAGINIESQKYKYIKDIIRNDDIEVLNLLINNGLNIENKFFEKSKKSKTKSPEIYKYLKTYLLVKKLENNLKNNKINNKRVKI